MKRPAFQFYPADYQRDANLRRCSHAARGAWMDVLCLLHDSDEYGVLRWPLVDLAAAAGAPVKLLKELSEKGVLRGADRNVPAYIFTPTHAGRSGDPVVLVESCDGPCWYSARFVRDEYVRSRRGASTQFTSEGQPDRTPKAAPKPPIGERQGDGPSSASSSSIHHEVSGESPPTAADPEDRYGQFEGHGESTPLPNPVAPFAIALNRLGFRCTSLTPDLVAFQREGGSVEHLTECAGLPDCTGKPAAYVLKIARRELTERATTITGANHESPRQRGNGGRLSAVEQVERAIAERREREAGSGRTFDA